MYKFGTRYYDPQTGRWTQKDPVGGSVGKIGSGDPYVYADDEPNMQVDPSGACSIGELIEDIVLLVTSSLIAIGTILSFPVSGPLTGFVDAILVIIGSLGVAAYYATKLGICLAQFAGPN